MSKLRLYRISISKRFNDIDSRHSNKYIAAADLRVAVAAAVELYPDWTIWSISHIGPIDHLIQEPPNAS
jgi:hypothetical protein